LTIYDKCGNVLIMKHNTDPVRSIVATGVALAGLLTLETACDESPQENTHDAATPAHEVVSTFSADALPKAIEKAIVKAEFRHSVEEVDKHVDAVVHGILNGMDGAVPSPANQDGLQFSVWPYPEGVQPPVFYTAELNDLPPKSTVYYDQNEHFLNISLEYGWHAKKNLVEVDYHISDEVNEIDRMIATGTPVTIKDITELVDKDTTRVEQLTVVNSNSRTCQTLSFDSYVDEATPHSVGYDFGGPESAILLEPYGLSASRRNVQNTDISLQAAQHTLFSMLGRPDAL